MPLFKFLSSAVCLIFVGPVEFTLPTAGRGNERGLELYLSAIARVLLPSNSFMLSRGTHWIANHLKKGGRLKGLKTHSSAEFIKQFYK
jgi:hypothetical protein